MSLPQYGEQPPAHLPVGARAVSYTHLVRLAAARRPLVLRLARQPPRALRGDRAAVARLALRRAHQRAQLHGGGGPPRGGRLVLRQQRPGQLALGGGGGVRRVLNAGDRAGDDPPHIGVQHRVPLTVGEGGHGGGRVLADARQRQQLRVVGRYVTAVPFRYRDGGAVQPQGAARVTEPAPGPDRLAGRFRGQVGGARPAGQPLLVDGQDAVHRRLLEHELTDHHAPRPGLGAPPRQVTGVLTEPVDDGGVEVLSEGGAGGRVGVGGGRVRGFRGSSHGHSILPREGLETGTPPLKRDTDT